MKLIRAFGFLTRLHRGQMGVSLVLVAITLTVLMGMTAMVVDIGTLVYNRRLAQNLVDAAVLAGVQELPGDPGAALTVADSFGAENGEVGDDLTITFPNSVTIRAEVTRNVPFTFARVLGITDSDVWAEAEAEAEVGSPLGLGGLLPFGVECLDAPPEENCGFLLGDSVELKLDEGPGSPGNWHALRLDFPPGANEFKQNIIDGADEIIEIGDLITPQTGCMDGPTGQGIDERLSQFDGNVTLEEWEASGRILQTPRPVAIPFVTQFGMGASAPVEVVLFGLFWLDGHDDHCGVTGRFLEGFTSLEALFGVYDPDSAIKIIHLAL